MLECVPLTLPHGSICGNSPLSPDILKQPERVTGSGRMIILTSTYESAMKEKVCAASTEHLAIGMGGGGIKIYNKIVRY